MNLCIGTPTISVRDNRGLGVRTLRYNRDVDGAMATQYIDAQTHNALGQPATSQDPRFFGGQTLNFQTIPALSGQVLETVSADAGTSKACRDIAGQPIWQYSQGRDANLQSDKNITVLLSYDALGRPVQRACYAADVSGGGSVGDPTDIWSYGDYSGPAGAAYDPADTTDPRNANQRGQLFQHFDTAGLIDISVLGYAVQSAPLRQDRRFLNVPCDCRPHWKPGTLRALYGLNNQWLESDTDPANLYSTQWAYDALNQVLTQVDAKGHQQHTAYDCAGRKYTASVTPNGGTLIPVCAGITYTAAGAIETRSDANNIRVVYVYESQTTQRLVSLTTTRASTTLQVLRYAYDGVGNVTALSDGSAGAQVSFFRNRAITPDRGYIYDALYQLTGASGRENYVDTTPKGTDWPGGQFNPVSQPAYQAYTRSYTYDAGGNLTGISSSDWSGAKRTMVVSGSSNRAVSTANNAGATQANIDTYFDLAGQSICLDANRNQPMYWTAFHQLYCVVTTYRPPTPGGGTGDWFNCDREQYAYDSEGQRVRKHASSLAGGIWNAFDTRYLPGLEVRGNTASGENLEVIVLDDGARILNWANGAGKPSDVPNLQLRFQYADRQNSCQIETDSAGNVITQEEYYPYGGTAVLTSRSNSEVKYKYIRYSGKERDATGFYYYGMRYYQPWTGRWLNPDPAGCVDGLNLYRAMGNNPATLVDAFGAEGEEPQSLWDWAMAAYHSWMGWLFPKARTAADADVEPDVAPISSGVLEEIEPPLSGRTVDGAANESATTSVDPKDILQAIGDAALTDVVMFLPGVDRETGSPQALFGPTIRYFSKAEAGSPSITVAGVPTRVNFGQQIDRAMQTLAPTAQMVGVSIKKVGSPSEANLLFSVGKWNDSSESSTTIAWAQRDERMSGGGNTAYACRIVFNNEITVRGTDALLAHYLINDDFGTQWRADHGTEFDAVRGINDDARATEIMSSVSRRSREAIAQALVFSTLIHEGGHGIFGLDHPDEFFADDVAGVSVDQRVIRRGDGAMLSGHLEGPAGARLFHIHSRHLEPVMGATPQRTLKQLGMMKTEAMSNGTEFHLDMDLNENEKASIIEAYGNSQDRACRGAAAKLILLRKPSTR